MGIEGDIKDGTEVNLQDKETPADDKQMWMIFAAQENGWFTMKSKANNAILLHANSEKFYFIGSKTLKIISQ